MGRADIRIAGAGPAGLAAAIILAKAGYKVRVSEQQAGVGRRFNDDYQGLENWSREEDVFEEVRGMGIEPTWWSRPFHRALVYNPALKPVNVQSQRPLFYMLRRGHSHPESLDVSLLNQAINAGVEFEWNRRLDAEGADIVACGPQGTPVAIARGMTFRIEMEDVACVILNQEMAPAGYVYFLVSDHQATLATVLFQNFKEAHTCMDLALETVKRLFGISLFKDAKHWGGYGLFSIPRSCERNGSLWIGEAAGFQDLLFGFGIRSALVSARLAAQSIISNSSYDDLWRARLLPHLKATLVSRAVYGGLGDVAKRGFWYLVGNNPHPDRFLRWLYSFSGVHKAIYPFVRNSLVDGR